MNSMYKENPKTKGSGIICSIPQQGRCPNGCEDCFFQSGRSYLEPLDENLPNVPAPEIAEGRIVRVNDGNDSNVEKFKVMDMSHGYKMRFYNTAIPKDLETFDAPIVLTVNPGKMTDTDVYLIEKPPKNLMFVRMRTNTWNKFLVDRVVDHYSKFGVPIVLTFMAYFKMSIPENIKTNSIDSDYIYRKRTLNSYYAITTAAWERVMSAYRYNKWVYSCGREGEKGVSGCRFCGNCIREYFATMERLRS